MQIDGYTFMADTVAKFHRSITVTGWLHHERDWLAEASITGSDIVAQVGEVGLAHPSVEPEASPGRGFRLQCLRREQEFAGELGISFVTRAGRRIEGNLLELTAERLAESASGRLYHRFVDEVARMHRPVVVDVGGRDRSSFDRSRDFPGTDYMVVDILPGDNVDVVADAHELSKHLSPESADVVISTATFEHLLMPWKVVVEMNRILKPGGLVCVISHQTLGLHDMPWDFWRFSADAWDGLLNHFTGFEIVERALAQEMFVIPFLYRPEMNVAEQSAGYEFSGVIARKTGPALVDWAVPLERIVSSRYPIDPGGPFRASRHRRGLRGSRRGSGPR